MGTNIVLWRSEGYRNEVKKRCSAGEYDRIKDLEDKTRRLEKEVKESRDNDYRAPFIPIPIFIGPF